MHRDAIREATAAGVRLLPAWPVRSRGGTTLRSLSLRRPVALPSDCVISIDPAANDAALAHMRDTLEADMRPSK